MRASASASATRIPVSASAEIEPIMHDLHNCSEFDLDGPGSRNNHHQLLSSSLPMTIPGTREGRTYRVSYTTRSGNNGAGNADGPRVTVEGGDERDAWAAAAASHGAGGAGLPPRGSARGPGGMSLLTGLFAPAASRDGSGGDGLGHSGGGEGEGGGGMAMHGGGGDRSLGGKSAHGLLPHHYRPSAAAAAAVASPLLPRSRRNSGDVTAAGSAPRNWADVLGAPLGSLVMRGAGHTTPLSHTQPTSPSLSSPWLAGAAGGGGGDGLNADSPSIGPKKGWGGLAWARNRSFADLGALPRGAYTAVGATHDAPYGSAPYGGSLRPASNTLGPAGVGDRSARAGTTMMFDARSSSYYRGGTASLHGGGAYYQQFGGGGRGAGAGGGVTPTAAAAAPSKRRWGMGSEPVDPQDVAAAMASLASNMATATLSRSGSLANLRGAGGAGVPSSWNDGGSVRDGGMFGGGVVAGSGSTHGGSWFGAGGGPSASDIGMGQSPRHTDTGDGPPPLPICLICLEMLTPEDFEEGRAVVLDCCCRGDVAMRHYSCAIEWNNAKGNVLCDICKHLIHNLPPIDPELLAARERARRAREPNFSIGAEHTLADCFFDVIRVAWVVMVLCILVWDMSMDMATLIGLAVGLLYAAVSWLCRKIGDAWALAAQQRHFAEERVDQAARWEEDQQRRAASRAMQEARENGRNDASVVGAAAPAQLDREEEAEEAVEPGMWPRGRGAGLREPLLIPPQM
ncbi:hypothetical protein FOA52_014511 [Chlamydomonas sp. UWO 241]|nr:hypothetical protein FOA52_014511 [Chlamydomonas sp. UWO 241]